MNARQITLLLLIACLCLTGCVRRRMTVRTNPPGATVYIDDQEIGSSPVSTSFVYYGTRKIHVVKDGYETETVMQRVKAPWYQIPGIDFVAENLVPREIRDERIVDIEMQPQRVVPTQELLERGQQLRTSTREGYTVPTPPSVESSTPMPNSPTELPPPFTPSIDAPNGTPAPFYPSR
jgi:hypothetical protein